AFHLAIRICCVRLELTEAKRLAARGHRAALAAGDSVRASHFSALRRCAHVVHYGLDRAQTALLAKRPEELLALVEAMDAVVEPELEAVL
ncbi:fhkC, partial [Symbiodinium sp. CCMP2456]